MSKVKVKFYGADGKEAGDKTLPAEIFGVKVKPELVHEVVLALLANARRPYAHTKTRGEVRGGGKKPWKQKGTGRARHGSSRSPIWVGGGITFGPRSDRNYSMKINRKAKRQAFLMSLSDKAAEGRLLLVESLPAKDGKTKEIAGLVGKLPVKGKINLVVPARDELVARAVRNLQKVRLNNAVDLGLMDVLRADYLVMTPAAAEKLAAVHTEKK